MKPLDPEVSMACMITNYKLQKKKTPFDGGGVGSGSDSPV